MTRVGTARVDQHSNELVKVLIWYSSSLIFLRTLVSGGSFGRLGSSFLGCLRFLVRFVKARRAFAVSCLVFFLSDQILEVAITFLCIDGS